MPQHLALLPLHGSMQSKKVFQSWTGLTTEVVSKYLTKSPATAMGHMDQTRKHVRYNKTDKAISQDDEQK